MFVAAGYKVHEHGLCTVSARVAHDHTILIVGVADMVPRPQMCVRRENFDLSNAVGNVACSFFVHLGAFSVSSVPLRVTAASFGKRCILI